MPSKDSEERKPAGNDGRQNDVTTETLVADRSMRAAPVSWDADTALTALYRAHYQSLVQLPAHGAPVHPGLAIMEARTPFEFFVAKEMQVRTGLGADLLKRCRQ